MGKIIVKNLDIRMYISGDKKEKKYFIKEIGDALAKVGFFTITGHEVNGSYLDKMYGEVRTLFDLNESVKTRYENAAINRQRGYTSFGVEKAKDAHKPDLKEFWHIGREGKSALDNVWPSELPVFKHSMLEFYNKMDEISFTLLKALSLYLGKKEEFLPGTCLGGESILRMIHYPAIGEEAIKKIPEGSVRAAAHEDINLITLLPAATSEGLQLLTKDGEWMDVETEGNCIIVDSGDMMQNMTGGILRSTTHRVANPKDFSKPRYSMPFFVHPRGEVSLSPDKDIIKKFSKNYINNKDKIITREITAEEYLSERLKEIGLKK